MQIITIQYFSEDWEKIKEVKLPIKSTGGWPVVDAFHTMGAYQSMQLNKEGNRLFVFLYDGYEGADEEPEPENLFTSLYVFDLDTKKSEKLFDIPRTNHVMWQYIEPRNSIIYYDDSLGLFTETSLQSGQKKPLYPITFNGTSSQLTATDSGFLFVYTRNDSVFKTAYTFANGLSKTTFLFDYPDFSSYEYNNLLVLGPSWKGNISFVITPDKKYTANIPFTNFNSYWKNKEQFYIIQKSGIAIYNTRFQLIKSYYLEHPHIYANLSAGLLISYGNQSFAFIDHDLTTLTNLPQVHDNFISCIAETH
ncbi:MAG: hypothetical protein IT247_02600 [Bacteroidia bacterium]|nr:hypothetical protein [Bacteroidia bacterium]